MGRKRKKKQKAQTELFDEIDEHDFEVKMNSKVIFENKCWKKIMYFVDKSPIEISFLGTVEIREGVPYVTDIIVPKQENTGSSTEMDPESIARAMYELRNSPGELRFWGHSHVDMSAFWSGTDHATIKMLGQNGWFISTVFNKKREVVSAYYSTQPFEIFLDKIETLIEAEKIDQGLVDQWDQTYEQNCKTKSYGYKDYGYGYKDKDSRVVTSDGFRSASSWEEERQRRVEDFRAYGPRPSTMTDAEWEKWKKAMSDANQKEMKDLESDAISTAQVMDLQIANTIRGLCQDQKICDEIDELRESGWDDASIVDYYSREMTYEG